MSENPALNPQTELDFSENPTKTDQQEKKQEKKIVIEGAEPLEEKPAPERIIFGEPTTITKEIIEQPQSSENSKVTAEQIVDNKFAQRERGREIITNLKTGVAGQVNKIKGFFGRIADRSRGIVNSVQQRSSQTIGGFVEKSQEYVGDKLAEGLGAGEQGIKGAIETSVQIGKKGSECLIRNVERVQIASKTLADNVSSAVNEQRRVSAERKIDQRFSGQFNDAINILKSTIESTTAIGYENSVKFASKLGSATDPEEIRVLNRDYYDARTKLTDLVVKASEEVTAKLEALREAVSQAKQRLAPQQPLNSY